MDDFESRIKDILSKAEIASNTAYDRHDTTQGSPAALNVYEPEKIRNRFSENLERLENDWRRNRFDDCLENDQWDVKEKILMQRLEQEREIFELQKLHLQLKIQKTRLELKSLEKECDSEENVARKTPYVTINQYRYDPNS